MKFYLNAKEVKTALIEFMQKRGMLLEQGIVNVKAEVTGGAFTGACIEEVEPEDSK